MLAQDQKPVAKKPPKIVISDPARLTDNPDFPWQGEFEGAAPTSDGKTRKFGMQIMAKGNGQLEHKTIENGLPGRDADAKTDNARMQKSELKEGKLHFANSAATGEMSDGNLTIRAGETNVLSPRVVRQSQTLGTKPPAGAVVLFNTPDDLKNWDKMKVVELSDGKYLGVGGRTKQKFQSFNLHIEFRLPFMPNSTGQGRGNSGVYLQDRYELQVLDSFGLKGENNECGGFYQIAAPKLNMCFPPMTWQTYDIDFTAAEFDDGKKTKPAVVTVKHNGVVIHDKLVLPKATPGGGIAKEVPEPGAIHLQDHGDPVVYRNIWIVEKK